MLNIVDVGAILIRATEVLDRLRNAPGEQNYQGGRIDHCNGRFTTHILLQYGKHETY